MSLGEFDLIRRYFQRPTSQPGLDLGIGDDCALLAPRPGMQWAVSTDMLVEGRHFFADVAPEHLGHKALAVNLSDLAACGATPRAFFLALSLPKADAAWCERFAQGLFALADREGIALAGGDTTAGPLNVCITVMGEVPSGQALLRGAGRAGDELWVSGQLGDARLALEALSGRIELPADALAATRVALEQPRPRVALGQALRGIASSAIDLSDGFVGDLGHVLHASGVGATLRAEALPRSAWLLAQPLERQRLCTLSGGDDYELIFTAPPARHAQVLEAARAAATPVTRVGRLDAESGLRLLDGAGRPFNPGLRAYDHFKA